MAYAILYLPEGCYVSDYPNYTKPAIFEVTTEAEEFIVSTFLSTSGWVMPLIREYFEIVEVEDV